ncbi:MAG TPA: NAD(P)/FAD-dependent oxidoreductase [Anaerolineales bacterium]|nr:NAD(P)/FAD-dependent oxidoreductase [Anaerolineales bacterium]
MYDLIVIGGGPAGLTATIYALRKRLNVLLITKDLGGKTNYRLQLPDLEHHLVINGEEVINQFVNEIEYLDFARMMDKVERVDRAHDGYRVLTRNEQQYAGRTVIYAAGANARRLDVPGEKEFMMRGLCYSAVSYAPLFIDRTVVVIGDAGLALRAAAELAQIARHVTLVAPTHGELDTPLGKRLLAQPNFALLEGYQVERVVGDQYARGLVVKKNADEREIRADAFFVELGLLPNTGPVSALVECDSKGRIKIDARNRTLAPGLFAAGDSTDAFAEQVLIAIGEGAKAALSAYEYLLEQPVEQAVHGEKP